MTVADTAAAMPIKATPTITATILKIRRRDLERTVVECRATETHFPETNIFYHTCLSTFDVRDAACSLAWPSVNTTTTTFFEPLETTM